MLFYDAAGPNPYVVRLFTLERGGLAFDTRTIDFSTLENRKPPYRTTINPRGECPALQINDSFVLTEITAICEYLDEVAKGGTSLFGSNALDRAETRMWLRRADLEIAEPLIAYFRNDPELCVDFYKGWRTPVPEARLGQKVAINQALNRLDEELEGKTWLCGDRFSAADILLYGLTAQLIEVVTPWVLAPGRKNVVQYFKRMEEREKSKLAKELFKGAVVV
ncbi:uncharacterized protein K452DRAFT_291848 [Aplosporella prunicola CBS 121167]|uniref:Glutathione S-transferase n=1 Tax=Aplosporella prunicola CBS 121167 TaxID=1176127 RepID=A0A6A6AYP3_9PEZI|nr:uncharacterized protein K452DRAFT_291848 [Aplosporella prunicola CBS 121167]KAF2137052.1 hypothetical protein K452DRAFT_291848 [Aplosporella prunicola CBS 121167]